MGFRINPNWTMNVTATVERPTNITISAVEPANPNEGDIWIDTSE